MVITEELSKEINSILMSDQGILELQLDDYLYSKGVDGLFDEVKKNNSFEDKDIQQIIYNLIYTNKISFFISIGTFSLYEGSFDRFFRLKCNFHHKLMNEIDLTKLELKDLTIEEVIKKIGELINDKSLKIVDGNWKDISSEEYLKVQLIFKISVNKDYKSLIELAEIYKSQKHIYNNLIINYLENVKDISKVNLLNCNDEIKRKVKADINKSKQIFYNDFYTFFEQDNLPSFADNNPFYQLYESLFESIKNCINHRKTDIISYGRKLKIASEQFENALRDSNWNVEKKANLNWKFDIIVNFGRWLYKLKDYFENEYYFIPELKNELFDYLDFIERKLYYPTIILLTSNLHEEKYTIFEEYLRYYTSEDFDFKKITDKIDLDYKANKTIQEICKRRKLSTLWEDEGGPGEGTPEKGFEDELFIELQRQYPSVERNKRLLAHTGTDFLASDGKNTLVLIEAKTGLNAAKPNNIKKLFPVIKTFEIKKSQYIINRDVTNPDSISNAKEFCNLMNIEFIQKLHEDN